MISIKRPYIENENGKVVCVQRIAIAPEIYGHFSEHLGRCIYEGLFVGENSDIPNVNGMRTDVVDALKEMKIPVAPLAGRLLCRRISLEGWYWTKGK